jgi:5-methylthioadenosine/S-adenosylhomocysteine deaminase
VKYAHALVGDQLAAARTAVEDTVSHLQSVMGDDVWTAGMNPDIPATKILDNPYTYTEYRTSSTHEAAEV